MIRNRGKLCSSGDGRPAYALGICSRCYRRRRHKGAKRIPRTTVEASAIGAVYVNRISGGRFGVFVGKYDPEEFFDPQLVGAYDTEPEAEQAARGMMRAA